MRVNEPDVRALRTDGADPVFLALVDDKVCATQGGTTVCLVRLFRAIRNHP